MIALKTGYFVQALAALEKTEFDEEGQLDDFAAAFLDQFRRRFRRAARGEQIVDDHHALVLFHRVDMHFQHALAILEFVFVLVALVGSFPFLRTMVRPMPR